MGFAPALLLYVLFYGSYILKMIFQKRRGISANKMGFGRKPSKTRIIEFCLMACTYGTALIQAAAFFTEPSPPLIRAVGFFLGLAGCSVFIAAMCDMKSSWRAGVDLDTKSTLVTEGIYRFSRNPAFLGFDLFYWGFTLYFPTPPIIMAALVLPILFHLQILEEEKSLELIFGESYIIYKSKTRRYI